LRFTYIVTIFKKGKKEDPGNYRTVSITSVSGKIMEEVILAVIKKRLRDNGVIGHSQHGVRREKSCVTNLISLSQPKPGHFPGYTSLSFNPLIKKIWSKNTVPRLDQLR